MTHSLKTRKALAEIQARFHISVVGLEDKHIVVWHMYSFTRPDHPGHEVRYCLIDKWVNCTCEDFLYTKQKCTPLMESGNVCKHIRVIRETLFGE